MTVTGHILVSLGTILMLLAGIGLLRLPDVFSRMHAGTKAASLGLAFVLAGTAFLLPTVDASIKLVIAMLFQFGTAPVAAHIIGRAAYLSGVQMWETHHDDLADAIDSSDEEGPTVTPDPS